MKAVIDRMRESDERMAQATSEFVRNTRTHLENIQAELDAMTADDPKAAAIELLRSEGWELIPPRR